LSGIQGLFCCLFLSLLPRGLALYYRIGLKFIAVVIEPLRVVLFMKRTSRKCSKLFLENDFLTAWPWAECGSCFTHGLFIYFFLAVTRPKSPIIQILSHATCDIFPPEAVKTLIHGQFYRYCFLCCGYNIFSFGFIEALDSKGVVNTLKKVLCQP